ncbi:MAG: CsgG/HfaB family protein [Paracoccaceae bacterium]
MTIKLAAAVAATLGLSACSTIVPATDPGTQPAELMAATGTGLVLERLPAPQTPIDVAVYDFPDLTGANEPGDDFAQLTRAVTQGGSHLLVDVLSSAGGGSWFNISERTGVQNLLREREIIEITQESFTGSSSLPALRFAGVLVEGAIIGYDSSEMTGGAGARYLGIGGFSEYRQDVVTVALRAVSVSSGRVLTSVTSTKTVYSTRIQAGVFRFIAVDEIAEAEWGYSRNEPEIFAVREAMEHAVLSMIIEGAEAGQWAFADTEAGAQIIQRYNEGARLVRLGYEPGETPSFDPVPSRDRALAPTPVAAPAG